MLYITVYSRYLYVYIHNGVFFTCIHVNYVYAFILQKYITNIYIYICVCVICRAGFRGPHDEHILEYLDRLIRQPEASPVLCR